jgi:hypothetical protein
VKGEDLLPKPQFLTLVYEWEEVTVSPSSRLALDLMSAWQVSPIDQNLGLDVLFLGSFILTLMLAAAVILSLPVEW